MKNGKADDPITFMCCGNIGCMLWNIIDSVDANDAMLILCSAIKMQPVSCALWKIVERVVLKITFFCSGIYRM